MTSSYHPSSQYRPMCMEGAKRPDGCPCGVKIVSHAVSSFTTLISTNYSGDDHRRTRAIVAETVPRAQSGERLRCVHGVPLDPDVRELPVLLRRVRPGEILVRVSVATIASSAYKQYLLSEDGCQGLSGLREHKHDLHKDVLMSVRVELIEPTTARCRARLGV